MNADLRRWAQMTAAGRRGVSEVAIAMVLALAAAALYAPVAAAMAGEWWHNENASHGMLVPIIAGWLAWRKRRRGAALVRPAPWGLAVIAAGLLLYGLGALAAIEFLPQLSLLVTLGGLMLTLWGRRTCRELAFPYAFLYFMVPWPDTLVEFASFPMQLFSAKSATMLVGLTGTPVSRDGVDIHLTRYSFSVAAPCSGMKSLVALLALAALIAYLLDGPRWKRWVLFAAGAPLAVVANVVRIVVILGIALIWGAKAAEGFFHSFSGLLVFLVATLALAAVGGALGLRPGAAVRPEPPAPASRQAPRWRHYLAPLALLLVAEGVALAYRGGQEGPRFHPDLARVPMQFAHWKGRELGPLDKTSRDMLRPDAYLGRVYRRDDGYPVEAVVIFGHEKQTFHSPGFCLLGGGWNIVDKARRTLVLGGAKVEANEFTLQRIERDPGRTAPTEVQRQVVLYWYASPGETTPSWVAFQYRLLRNRLAGRSDRGALIRLSAPTAAAEAGPAEQALEGLAAEVVPELTRSMDL